MAECPGCESSRLVPQTVQNVRKRTCQHCCVSAGTVGEDQEWERLIEGSGSEENGMSAAHKAKLKAAAKKRWAAIRAGKAPNPFAAKE